MVFDNIKRLAEEQGKSINSIEKACGLSTGSVYKWNDVSPTAKSLKAVADYLGVSMEYLLKE